MPKAQRIQAVGAKNCDYGKDHGDKDNGRDKVKMKQQRRVETDL